MENRIPRPHCPCKGCVERFIGCHIVCEGYADYKDKATRYNAGVKKKSLYYYIINKKGK